MIINQKNGGPAFPRAGSSGPGAFAQPENGMTLRDFFAAKAMESYIIVFSNDAEHPDFNSAIVSASYQLADKMLKEREK